MSKLFPTRFVAFALFFAGTVCLDQLSKKYFANTICNGGIAFGLKFGNVFLISLILVTIFFLILREKNSLSIAGLTLIFAGGVSNFWDRLVFGCVRDFVAIYKFPIFNLADAIITIGVAVLAVSYFGVNKRWK